jgi:hypothetical protein
VNQDLDMKVVKDVKVVKKSFRVFKNVVNPLFYTGFTRFMSKTEEGNRRERDSNPRYGFP